MTSSKGTSTRRTELLLLPQRSPAAGTVAVAYATLWTNAAVKPFAEGFSYQSYGEWLTACTIAVIVIECAACLDVNARSGTAHFTAALLWLLMAMEVVLSFVEFTRPIPRSFFDIFHSAQFNYFTTWSLIWHLALLGATLLLHALRLALPLRTESAAFRAVEAIVQTLGYSVSLCLFFCAASLFGADQGTTYRIQRGCLWRMLVAFAHKHFLQVAPWLVIATDQNAERALNTSSVPTPTPPALVVVQRIAYILAPFIPYLSWAAHSAMVGESTWNSDYPPILPPSAACIVVAGLLPWAVLAFRE